MKNIVLACMTVNALIGAGTVKHTLCVANQLSWATNPRINETNVAYFLFQLRNNTNANVLSLCFREQNV